MSNIRTNIISPVQKSMPVAENKSNYLSSMFLKWLNFVRQQVNNLSGLVSDLQTDVDSLSGSVVDLQTDVDSLSGSVVDLQTDVDGIDNQLSTVYSGTYMPIATPVINVANITTYQSQFMRVGNVVNISGLIDVTTPALGYTQFTLSLPTSATFTDFEQAGGVANGSNQSSFYIFADSISNQIKFEADPSFSQIPSYYSYTAQYLIE